MSCGYTKNLKQITTDAWHTTLSRWNFTTCSAQRPLVYVSDAGKCYHSHVFPDSQRLSLATYLNCFVHSLKVAANCKPWITEWFNDCSYDWMKKCRGASLSVFAAMFLYPFTYMAHYAAASVGQTFIWCHLQQEYLLRQRGNRENGGIRKERERKEMRNENIAY